RICCRSSKASSILATVGNIVQNPGEWMPAGSSPPCCHHRIASAPWFAPSSNSSKGSRWMQNHIWIRSTALIDLPVRCSWFLDESREYHVNKRRLKERRERRTSLAPCS